MTTHCQGGFSHFLNRCLRWNSWQSGVFFSWRIQALSPDRSRHLRTHTFFTNETFTHLQIKSHLPRTSSDISTTFPTRGSASEWGSAGWGLVVGFWSSASLSHCLQPANVSQMEIECEGSKEPLCSTADLFWLVLWLVMMHTVCEDPSAGVSAHQPRCHIASMAPTKCDGNGAMDASC